MLCNLNYNTRLRGICDLMFARHMFDNIVDTVYCVSRETELARLVPITHWDCKASLHRRVTMMSFGTSGFSVTSQMVG